MKTRFLIIIGIIMMTTIPFVTIMILDRYDNYLEQLEYERQAIANEPKPGERSYIEPVLKAKLEKVELELREKVKQLHEGLPSSSYAVNLNHQTKKIEAFVENKHLIPKIEEFVTKYPDDITIVVDYGKVTVDYPWYADEDYCGEWCDQSELYDLGCNSSILAHLAKYSNLLDEDFDGSFYIDLIGLPDGVYAEKFEWCADFIYEKRISYEFDKTWGGPGNRHPAFLGYDIPEICTDDMIKHLVKHSSMFGRSSPYMLEWISMDDRINVDDFDRCVDELLERNPKDVD